MGLARGVIGAQVFASAVGLFVAAIMSAVSCMWRHVASADARASGSASKTRPQWHLTCAAPIGPPHLPHTHADSGRSLSFSCSSMHRRHVLSAAHPHDAPQPARETHTRAPTQTGPRAVPCFRNPQKGERIGAEALLSGGNCPHPED